MAFGLAAAPVFGDGASEMDAEIDYLIEAVADSGCVFIRNGREHSASEARDHLQMKRRRGKRYYDTTEEFIERIASRSSWSGKAYFIRCAEHEPVTAKSWFAERLDAYRAKPVSP